MPTSAAQQTILPAVALSVGAEKTLVILEGFLQTTVTLAGLLLFIGSRMCGVHCSMRWLCAQCSQQICGEISLVEDVCKAVQASHFS